MKVKFIVFSIIFFIKILLQYILVNPVYELHRDEFLYLNQAYYPAWGFRSVPPFTSWISWIVLQLGATPFWVRFFPALFGALTILIVLKTVETLRGGLYAYILAGTALLCSTAFLRLNMLFHANSVDIFCWTLLFYFFIKFIQTERPKWIYLTAFVFAVGFLNKYNIVFLLIGLFPAMLLSPQRKLLSKKYFYGAVTLGLIIISPNLIWQLQNGFPVLKHLKELSDTQLIYVNRFDFFREQIYFFLGSFFVLAAGFISLFNYRPFKPYRILFWSYLFTILLFIYLKAKAYYAFGLYPILLAFGSVYISEILRERRLYYLYYATIGVILLSFWPLIEISMPTRPPQEYEEAAKDHKSFNTHTWEDGGKHAIAQDFADMLGWKELAHKIDSIYISTSNKEHIVIFCDNYGQAGSINYYSKVGLNADSFNADYLDWINPDKEIKTIIRVKESEHTDLSVEKALFNEVKYVGEIENRSAREKGTRILILTRPKEDVSRILDKEAQKLKSNK